MFVFDSGFISHFKLSLSSDWTLTFLHPISWEFLLWDTEGLFASLLLSADFQDREPLLFGPGPHDSLDGFAARLSQSPP